MTNPINALHPIPLPISPNPTTADQSPPNPSAGMSAVALEKADDSEIAAASLDSLFSNLLSGTTALVPSSPQKNLESSAASSALFQHHPSNKTRKGKIAHLPQAEREMVNRMLANNLPYSKIVAALEECNFQVTERNVSNWKTHGGYSEWCAAQDHALVIRTFQDNLTESLRRHDAAELPEVGLQSAATALSAIFLRPDLISELLSDPQKYTKLIEIQCRLAREIQALQKNRDEASKAFGHQYNPELLKRQNQAEVEQIREFMSSEIGKGPREPNIPHRNFIPQQLEPFPEPRPPIDYAALLQSRLNPAKHRPTATPPAPPHPPQSKT